MQTNYELRKKILQRLKLFVTRLEVLKLKNKPFHHHLTTTFVNQKRKLYKKKYINIFLTKKHQNNYFSGILRYYRAYIQMQMQKSVSIKGKAALLSKSCNWHDLPFPKRSHDNAFPALISFSDCPSPAQFSFSLHAPIRFPDKTIFHFKVLQTLEYLRLGIYGSLPLALCVR